MKGEDTMNYPYSYTVVFIDGTSGETVYKRESGMGIAESFRDACGQVEGYYGNDLISIKHLELHDDCGLIILPEHIALGYSEAGYLQEAKECDIKGNLFTEMVEDARAKEETI